jgi:hypothetical protein
MEFGSTRGILGVEGGELNQGLKKLGITRTEAFTSVPLQNSGAQKSGLQKAIS